jgi:hypothetical protein
VGTAHGQGGYFGQDPPFGLTQGELVLRLPFWETLRGRLGLAALLLSPFALLVPNGETGMGGLIGLGLFGIGASAFRPTLVITPDLITIRRPFTAPEQADRAQIGYVAVYDDRAEFTDPSGGTVLTMKPVWRSMQKYAEAATALAAELVDNRYVTGSWTNPYRGD